MRTLAGLGISKQYGTLCLADEGEVLVMFWGKLGTCCRDVVLGGKLATGAGHGCVAALHHCAAISLGSHALAGEALERRCRYPEEDCDKYQSREMFSNKHDFRRGPNRQNKDSLLSHGDAWHPW